MTRRAARDVKMRSTGLPGLLEPTSVDFRKDMVIEGVRVKEKERGEEEEEGSRNDRNGEERSSLRYRGQPPERGGSSQEVKQEEEEEEEELAAALLLAAKSSERMDFKSGTETMPTSLKGKGNLGTVAAYDS
jgi:hypothetical protein